MTATSDILTMHGEQDHLAHLGSCSLASPTGEMIVVDSNGKLLGPNRLANYGYTGQKWLPATGITLSLLLMRSPIVDCKLGIWTK